MQPLLRTAALNVISTPQMRDRLAELGFEQGEPRSTAVLRQALRADHDRVGAVLKSIGLQPT